MKLAHLTWPEVEAISRDAVVLVPTGSLEQHGPHLPLFTDSLIVTAVAEEMERRLPAQVLLTPTLWLGASKHHLAFPGSLSASYDGYVDSLMEVIRSLHRHGFWRFYVVNGHGGNTSLNDIACRKLADQFPELQIGHRGYFEFAGPIADLMEGPAKEIRHACEAETSLMLHLHPDLVHMDCAIDDGLSGPVPGMVHGFSVLTQKGVLGFATKASAEKGRAIFERACDGLESALKSLSGEYALRGIV